MGLVKENIKIQLCKFALKILDLQETDLYELNLVRKIVFQE